MPKAKKTNNSATKDIISLVDVTVREIMRKLEMDVDIDASFDEENDFYGVDIQSEDHSGLLIGKQGDTLNSLQRVLAHIIKQKTGEWVRVVVNVADWREKQTRRVEDLADRASERAIQSGQSQALYNLTTEERRLLHMRLANTEDI